MLLLPHTTFFLVLLRSKWDSLLVPQPNIISGMGCHAQQEIISMSQKGYRWSSQHIDCSHFGITARGGGSIPYLLTSREQWGVGGEAASSSRDPPSGWGQGSNEGKKGRTGEEDGHTESGPSSQTWFAFIDKPELAPAIQSVHIWVYPSSCWGLPRDKRSNMRLPWVDL